MILFSTAIPFEGSDGMRVIKLFKDNKDIDEFQAVSDSFDTNLSSDDILNIYSTNEPLNEYAHFIIALAQIEKLSSEEIDCEKILEISTLSKFDEELLEDTIVFYQIFFKSISNQKITDNDYNFLQKIDNNHGYVITLMNSYILTGEKKYIENIKSNLFYANDFIQKKITLNIIEAIENPRSKA